MARPRGDISERLVKAAREAFLTQGVDGASLREIAAEAGTSLGMITYYFPTKDDLFLAVLERSIPSCSPTWAQPLAATAICARRSSACTGTCTA